MKGRPSIYSEKLADKICERLASGESLLSICKDEGFPHESTVRAWALDDREGFYTKYARAREIQAEVMADQILEIADDGLNDFKEVDGRQVVDQENIQRSKLRVDTRKWLMSKVLPKKYGDKVTTAITDGEGGPLKVVFERIAPKSYIDESSKVS
jgi:hypothetical protein